MSLDTGNRSGKVTKYVTVYTNDPGKPMITLKVHTVVAAERK